MTPFDLPPRALFQDDARPGGVARIFRNPFDWIEARDAEAVPDALARIDSAVAAGRWVAGGFSFELGYLLEPQLRRQFRTPHDPLIAVGVYAAPEIVRGGAAFEALAANRVTALGEVEPAWDSATYAKAFAIVRDYIAAGDAYQINLTFPLSLALDGDPFARLAAWRSRARAGHAAILRLDDRDVFSFSPELFLQSSGEGVLRARPMKGTIARGADNAKDEAAREALRCDEKQRAENLMIVDLLRNDLSRICEAGSVRVTDLFSVETYPTLHTMTTGIEGRVHPDCTPSAMLRALFPCGSVTGAPKIRAMEIIAETEAAPRGFYCGAIGAIGPDLATDLNVAIRTLVHEHGSRRLRMGVGGGVVYDSTAQSEYEEALLKARFATAKSDAFDLLETMRWEWGVGFFFLDEHLARMQDAARYFQIPYHDLAIRAALDAYINRLSGMRRVRLRLTSDGTPFLESAVLDAPFSNTPNPLAQPLRLSIAGEISSRDPFARHKTTRRAVYDAALAEAKARGADEAILLNEHGRVADGSFTSIYALRYGMLVTSPTEEGALPGVFTRVLRKRAAPPISEAPLTIDDLKSADALFAGNSVRGLLPARLA